MLKHKIMAKSISEFMCNEKTGISLFMPNIPWYGISTNERTNEWKLIANQTKFKNSKIARVYFSLRPSAMITDIQLTIILKTINRSESLFSCEYYNTISVSVAVAAAVAVAVAVVVTFVVSVAIYILLNGNSFMYLADFWFSYTRSFATKASFIFSSLSLLSSHLLLSGCVCLGIGCTKRLLLVK